MQITCDVHATMIYFACLINMYPVDFEQGKLKTEQTQIYLILEKNAKMKTKH